ncbi:RNA-directed DNA polymerase (reverse transcriptase)-related family protein [Rhynchospora pubera]|uniref:RNA-directed DNA polymerase (Reverse transcriptase)-related family protein n=1 Tax=Rhynchospora pubera TaxID=906938 RepID=A0AAV8C8H2_9POAL|nr:RNA-directed DNA polymerase (reverse transcriptase)-related family protein [Rhynchospora pubera]
MWTDSEEDLRRAFVTYFKSIFCSQPLDPCPFWQQLPVDFVSSFPSLPQQYSSMLNSLPLESEITATLFSLPPDRAPGPDGINARFIQSNWHALKPIVPQQVNQFFSTKVMDKDIAKSNLILIPKKDYPQLVSDYRPISVCNVIYKIISQLLSRRLQPFIPNLVSLTQTAFTPGRQIGDNIRVFREVIHTFSLSSFHKPCFCLKADLSKAFDKLNWRFIFTVLHSHGLPKDYIDWIMACVTSSRFSIALNGATGGFIQPTRGVRQGCSLSPYLFIVALDVLSRLLSFMVQKGELKGVTIARGAPTLTSLLYADDLLIFGEASYSEVWKIQNLLNVFCAMSGQEIGVDKSRIWFSKHTPLDVQHFISTAFAASKASSNDVYLGTTIVANRPGDFGPLLDKIDNKLQPWKRQFLSQAGKVVLIKSVIEPLLLYTMSTTALPAATIRAIEGKLRAFFWDKGGASRVPLVAWKLITRPKDHGGLGLKDLTSFNRSLHMKALWSIVTSSSAIWIAMVKAKYLSRATIWNSQRSTKCTALWRALLGVRQLLQDNVQWQIGNGNTCGALGEPWHDMWRHYQPSNAGQRRLKISDLLNSSNGTWNTSKLIELFGFHGALYLAIAFPSHPVQNQHPDRLIFTAAQNGKFTLKGAYQLIEGHNTRVQHYQPHLKHLFHKIWNAPQILPRVRIFLWKVINSALPLEHLFATRFGKQPQGCHFCGNDKEDVVHALFKCDQARQVWLNSGLGIRSDMLPDDVKEILTLLTDQFDDHQMSLFAAVIWNLWKQRCKLVFEGKSFSVQVVNRAAGASVRLLTHAAMLYSPTVVVPVIQDEHPETDYCCYLDGSWLAQEFGASAGAYVIMDKEGMLVQYGCFPLRSNSPIHSEILALKAAVMAVNSHSLISCTFFTDCAQLSSIMQGVTSIELVDWHCFHDLLDLKSAFNFQGFKCKHVGRELNGLADEMAKYARVWG